MSGNLSANRLVRNEQIIRNRNTEAKKSFKKRFLATKKARSTKLEFMCECSAIDCSEKIPLTILAYEKIHKRKDRFVLAPGHEIDAIESVLIGLNQYSVVEKKDLAP